MCSTRRPSKRRRPPLVWPWKRQWREGKQAGNPRHPSHQDGRAASSTHLEARMKRRRSTRTSTGDEEGGRTCPRVSRCHHPPARQRQARKSCGVLIPARWMGTSAGLPSGSKSLASWVEFAPSRSRREMMGPQSRSRKAMERRGSLGAGGPTASWCGRFPAGLRTCLLSTLRSQRASPSRTTSPGMRMRTRKTSDMEWCFGLLCILIEREKGGAVHSDSFMLIRFSLGQKFFPGPGKRARWHFLL